MTAPSAVPVLSYPIQERESERLSFLSQSDIMDSEAETAFDSVTRRVKDHFGVEIALVSLVDQNRQWFKSRCGIDVSETIRDVAFCNYTILSTDVMVVNDAQADLRFHNNPLVTGSPYIRFYAGAPIIVPDGLVLGTLCLIDSQPRDTFTDEQAAELSRAASAVSQLIQKKVSS